jgi:hypothetical protein
MEKEPPVADVQEKVAVRFKCADCNSSGVYRGQFSPKGFGIVCNYCGGSGATTFGVTPSEGRQLREDVHTVVRVSGKYVDWLNDPKMTYQEFLDQVPAAEVTV